MSQVQRETKRVKLTTTTTRPLSSSKLPSTLTGPPITSLVPPKQCQFGDDFVSVPLLETFPVSDSSSVFRFGLPDTSKPLNLSTCACILAQAKISTTTMGGGNDDDDDDHDNDEEKEEVVVRPYTPISTNAAVGFFDLLVKNYGAQAKMSRHLHEMKEGDQLQFKHIDFSK